MTEDEMVGWHHWLNGHEFEQALGEGEGQGGLACCSPWGCKESDMTERLNSSNKYCSVDFTVSISFFLRLSNISLYEFTTRCLSIHLFMDICTFSLELYLFKSCAHLLIGVLDIVCSIIWLVGLYQICNCKYPSHFGGLFLYSLECPLIYRSF